MALLSDRSIRVPVFLDGTLPRYGFWRWIACALGVVVPSAGLVGRGRGTEYPGGPPGCPQTAPPKARANVPPRALHSACPFPPPFPTTGLSLCTGRVSVHR